MTTAILAMIALAGPLAPAAKPEFQAQTDYSQALKVAATEKKPMVVLIGKGDSFAKMMTDSNMTTEAKKLLAEKYVCLTVDVNTEAGKSLAGQFQMTDGGLVISSAGGSHQALRHPGAVTANELSKHTATYVSVAAVPATTVGAGVPVQATYYTYPYTYSSCPGGNCGSTVIPAGYYSTPFYGSSCPNGRCPNAR
jgi:hypothetical protein